MEVDGFTGSPGPNHGSALHPPPRHPQGMQGRPLIETPTGPRKQAQKTESGMGDFYDLVYSCLSSLRKGQRKGHK